MLDQSQFRLLSGSSALDCLSVGDFETIRDTIEQRLLLSLCLTVVPTEDLLLWDQLLADTISVSVDVKQDDGIKSESMRNYSYTMQDYAGTWAVLAMKSGDLIDRFNACDSGIKFQRNVAGRIYGLDGFVVGCRSCRGDCECI